MLRSTGFFRGIDCPFYKEYSNVKGDKEGCTRPYCHFRHKRRLSSYGAAIEVNKTKELIKQEQGYDPFNPEVVRPENQQNGESSSSVNMGVLELELVNRAIEEVRSEVEREKRKLSRIEDEEYAPTISSSSSSSKIGVKRVSPAAVASHLAYDPGSYQMTSTTDYNPTPRSSKYTLDSDNQEYTASSMEYVPTSVAKASVKKHLSHSHTTQLPSPPPKYSTNAASPKCKYTIDTSKPSTDMEYDPLSNFSARIAGKKKKTEVTELLVNKKNKLPGTRKSSMDEEYVPTVKKPRHQSIAAQKYTLGFSESDEESSGTEYRPTSLKRLQHKKSSCVSREDAMKVVKESTEGLLRELKQKKEDSIIEEEENLQNQEVRLKFKPDNDKIPGKNSHDTSRKFEKVPKVDKEKEKSSISGMDNRAVSREECKKTFVSNKLSHDSIKKDCKKQLKKEEGKSRVKEKSIEKSLDKGKEGASHVGRVKTIEKVKHYAHTRDEEREKRDRNSKKMKSSDKEIQKHKEPRNKSCKIDGSRKETDIKKSNKNCSNTSHKCSSNNSSKSSCIGSKEKTKTSCSSSGKTSGKVKERSLSHVDLFGDESAEEHEKVGDDDEEEEEILVRKSAAAFRRGGLNKRKASELTRSSSEDEDGVDGEDDRADVEEFDAGGVDYSSLQVDLDFDSDPMEECLRIFNESKDVKREDKGRQAKQPPRESEEDNDHESTLTTLFPGQKKRVSHFSANRNADSAPKTVVQHQRRLTAQEICYQRMKIAQQQAAQLAMAVKTASASHVQSRSPTFPGERKRVAHRPSPMASSSKSAGPADTKPAASRGLSSPNALPGLLSVKAHTSAGILSKTTTTVAQKRMAHTPTMKSTTMKRPIIPTEFGAKVPTNVRQRYLNIFIDECVKFCPSEDIACQMGLEEEKVVYDRSSGKNIYLNVAVNTLKKLRSKSGIPSTNTKTPAVVAKRKIQSHEEVLGGRLAAKTSFTINRTGKQQEEKLIGATLYRKLKEYLMTEEQLQEHCYPRPHLEISGHAVVFNVPEKKTTDPFSKVCCRCGAQYKVNVHGSCVRKEECNHHWGRLRKHKVSGGWETNYSCCSGAVGAPGCQVAKQHVQDGRKESLDGYVQTFSKSLPSDGNGGVYALDCEMCYTKQGLELTRVTVINADLKVIYDTFVKPESKVVDYNTRFSGVTEEDLENATITLRDVQAVMLNMFSAESILIGHSLESDLFALKLIHSTVVDTAIVFPHRLGLPYKRALRNLMADHLKRIIQDNVEGHDSSEDASACMELMMWKIREDAKVKR